MMTVKRIKQRFYFFNGDLAAVVYTYIYYYIIASEILKMLDSAELHKIIRRHKCFFRYVECSAYFKL